MKHVMPFSLDLLISWYLRLSATQSRLRVTSWCCSGQLKFYRACWDDSNVGLSGWINLVLREEQKQWHMSTFVPRPPIPPSAMQRLFFTKRVSNRYQICAKKCMEQIKKPKLWKYTDGSGRYVHMFFLKSLFVRCSASGALSLPLATIVHFENLMHSCQFRDRLQPSEGYNTLHLTAQSSAMWQCSEEKRIVWF